MRNELFLEHVPWPQERGPVLSEWAQSRWGHLLPPGCETEETEEPKSFGDQIQSRGRRFPTSGAAQHLDDTDTRWPYLYVTPTLVASSVQSLPWGLRAASHSALHPSASCVTTTAGRWHCASPATHLGLCSGLHFSNSRFCHFNTVAMVFSVICSHKASPDSSVNQDSSNWRKDWRKNWVLVTEVYWIRWTHRSLSLFSLKNKCGQRQSHSTVSAGLQAPSTSSPHSLPR